MESKKINQLATELTPALSDLTIIGDPTTGISKKITLSQMASLFTGTVEEYANLASFPLVGVADTIYIALDTNVLYRWDTGLTSYVELSPNIINSLVFSDANGFDGTISLVGSVATLTITTALTTGSVGFIGASGALVQDNANFFWDDTNNRLGIGTNAPTTAIDTFGSGIITRVNGTSTNNAFIGFASAGTNKWSIGNVQSDHRFRIYNEATTSELVSVLQTGEFGIGIANPTTKLHIDGGASALIANLDANVSVAKSISFRSDNSARINFEVSGTESGSNAGANFYLRTYTDAGSLLATPLTIERSTGNATFSGILITPQVKAATSAGLSINANSGTQVADFGAGGSANITFFGGLSGTSATFSGNVAVGTTIVNGTGNLQVGGSSNGSLFAQQGTDTIRMGVRATGRTGIVFDSSDATFTNRMWYIDNVGASGTLTIGRSGLDILSFANTGAATFSSSLTANSTLSINLTNGSVVTRDNGTSQIELNIRHSSTRNGVLSFTENAVADRWAIGTKPSDGTLYFSSGFDLSTPRFTLSSVGAAAFSNDVTITGLLTLNRNNILISGAPLTGTNSIQFNLNNTGGSFSVGIDNSTGTYMLASGGLAYASTISTNNATALILGTNLTARLTIASTGGATFSSSLTANSTISALLVNGLVFIRDTGAEQVEVNIRHTSTRNGVLSFTENGVADRWAIGTKPNDGTLYFSANYNLSTVRGTLTSAGVWNTSGGGTSDARTKDDIDYNFDNGIESVLKLQPTKFKFKNAPGKQRRGFIAQDVLQAIPDLVLGDGEKENGTYGLDYDGISALTVKAIQEIIIKYDDKIQKQQVEIEELKTKLS